MWEDIHRKELTQNYDDYIKGLIVHEISEMSYSYTKWQENYDSLKKMKPRARQIVFGRWTKNSDDPGSKEYQEHEVEVNKEGIRLGFQKEIDALGQTWH